MKSYVVHVTEKSTQRYLVEAEDAAEARQAIIEGGGLRLRSTQEGEIDIESAGDWKVEDWEVDEEPEYCGACSGTGEGWNETVNCSTCNGTGMEGRIEAWRPRVR